jgi:hypothetical protein
MDRLELEMLRLYGLQADRDGLPDGAPHGAGPAGSGATTRVRTGVRTGVRTFVLETLRPADWPALSRLWQAVQGELALPAPAIAVSGADGHQLWFSLAQPVAATAAAAFAAALQARYLADVPAARLRCWPGTEGKGAGPGGDPADSPPWPAPQPEPRGDSGLWSAFVAPDLAGLFTEEAGLALPPGPGGQADLLSRLRSIEPADFERAVALLQPAPPSGSPPTEPAAAPPASAPGGTPERFLQDVMNDERVDLALRIEAAKALLGARPGAAGSAGA